VAEEVGTFGWREAWDKVAERAPGLLEGSQCLGAQQNFEFGEGQFNRVQIRTVGWQVEQLGAARLDRLANAGNLVRAQIVHDDDIATGQRRRQHLLDIGKERLSIDRSIEHAGSDQAVLAQTGDEEPAPAFALRHAHM
jgi:hypothetical protein